jgi:hypothetical protein
MRSARGAESRLMARTLSAVALALVVRSAPAQTVQPASAPPAAQSAPASGDSPALDPLAIVPIDASDAGGAATVTGALEVSGGKAKIGAGGTITAGSRTTNVVLPHRGVLRVCASTTVKLAADSSVPAGDTPGLLMAIDHGAVEMSFATTPATGTNADMVLTPDFRILIAGPGSSDLKVRLGEDGDTCVDNTGASAPYVVVTSLFDPGLYRVQPGQRVMFQHGSLNEVVDTEREPCGCPTAPATTASNEFPLAQSEGLAPTPVPAPAPKPPANGPATPGPLVYANPPIAATKGSAAPAAQPAAAATPPAAQTAPAPAQPAPAAQQKKPGFFKRIGNFFRRVFGAE